jgi:hypothetical protein
MILDMIIYGRPDQADTARRVSKKVLQSRRV